MIPLPHAPVVHWRLVERAALWGALFSLLSLIACDDAGRDARRALSDRFLQRMSSDASGSARTPSRSALLAGEGWSTALSRAAGSGGVSWTTTVTYEAEAADGRRAQLEVETRLDLRTDGGFHSIVRHHYQPFEGRSGETSREAWWVDHLLYTRVDGGAFFGRRALRPDHDRWRDAPVEAAAGLLRALGSTLEARPDGAAAARWRLVSRASAGEVAPGPTAREKDVSWPGWLASRYIVEAVDGTVELSTDGREIRAVTLRWSARGPADDRGNARSDNAARRLTVNLHATAGPLVEGADRWRPPSDWKSPVRDRAHDRVQRILAPFSPGPGSTSGPSPAPAL